MSRASDVFGEGASVIRRTLDRVGLTRDNLGVGKRGLLSLGIACLTALVLTGSAAAQPPTLLTIDQQNRHARATFYAAGADDATIYIASKPDRASDGGFLQENIEDLDILTTDEIQAGSWLGESQLDPGIHYVMLRATDFDCYGNPSCIDGYSNVLSLNVPEPTHTYRGSVSVLRYSHIASLTLRVTRLGKSLPYKVCWRLKSKKRRCVSGRVVGYSWNDSAEGTVSIRLRGMARRTTFGWYVGGHRVASKTANTRA
jgi:hypothetical protein